MKTFLTTLAVCIAFFNYAFTCDAQNCVQIPGLVSWWPGESNAVDAVGGNTGVLLNGATFAPGKFGQAFSLTGGAHVRITDNGSLHFTNGLTVAAWVNPTDSGYSYHILSSGMSFTRIKRVLEPGFRAVNLYSVCALTAMNYWGLTQIS